MFVSFSIFLYIIFYRFVPESFRWLITRHRYQDAERVVGAVAYVNRAAKPDLTKIIELAKDEENTEKSSKSAKKYSAIDLFKTKEGVKNTIGLIFMW